MRKIKMARSLDTVHTHTHTQYLYRIGGQAGENYNLNKKDIKLFASKIANIIVAKISNIKNTNNIYSEKNIDNIKNIYNKLVKDRLFYKNKIACPFCCL